MGEVMTPPSEVSPALPVLGVIPSPLRTGRESGAQDPGRADGTLHRKRGLSFVAESGRLAIRTIFRPSSKAGAVMLILVVGFVFVAVGVLWVLQGTNIATGSGMSGESQYAVLGAI